MKHHAWWAVLLLLLVVPLTAQASDGYVTVNLNMRAGPDVEYPIVSTIPAGSPVAVQGCTQGWGWCDVVANGYRGWVAADYIDYTYRNQRVVLPSYASEIGIPVISFAIEAYWGSHYRNEPFYRNRQTWYRRPVPHRAPPRRAVHRRSYPVAQARPRASVNRHPATPRRAPAVQHQAQPSRNTAPRGNHSRGNDRGREKNGGKQGHGNGHGR